MKASVWQSAGLIALMAVQIDAALMPQPQGNIDGYNYSYSLSDEFDGDVLDLTKWDTTMGGWHGAVPGVFQDANLVVEGGQLTIKTEHDDSIDLDKLECACKDSLYTTGLLVSKAEFKEGFFEVKTKLAHGSFLQSLWFQGEGGEINWMDAITAPTATDKVESMVNNYHCFDMAGTGLATESQPQAVAQADLSGGGRPSDAFHVYGIERSKERGISMYVDGSRIRHIAPENTPECLLMPMNFIISTEILAEKGLPDEGSSVGTQIAYFKYWTRLPPPPPAGVGSQTCPAGETLFEETLEGTRMSRFEEKYARMADTTQDKCAERCATEASQCGSYTFVEKTGVCMLFQPGETATKAGAIYVTAFKKEKGCSPLATDEPKGNAVDTDGSQCVGDAKFEKAVADNVHKNLKKKLDRKGKVKSMEACMALCAANSECVMISYGAAGNRRNQAKGWEEVCFTFGEGTKTKPITKTSQGGWMTAVKLAPSCAAVGNSNDNGDGSQCVGNAKFEKAAADTVYKNLKTKLNRKGKVKSMEACMAICATDPDCGMVAYGAAGNKRNEAKGWEEVCYTFEEGTQTKAITKSFQGSWMTAVKLAPSCQGASEQPEECPFGDAIASKKGKFAKKLARKGAQTLASCLKLCSDADACKTVTFTTNGGLCLTFTTSAESDLLVGDGTDAYIKGGAGCTKLD